MIYTTPQRLVELKQLKLDQNPIALWSNKATAANVSAPNGAVALFPASNLVTGGTNERCQPVVSGGEYIVETTETLEADALAIDSHNIGAIGGSLYVETSDDGLTWGDSGLGEIIPENDAAIYCRLQRVTKYYRLRVVAASQVAIGIFMVGDELIIEQRAYGGLEPPLRPNQVTAEGQVSEGGEFIGSTMVSRGSTFSLPIEYVRDTTLRSATWLGFIDHFNEKRPFFFAWRPTKYATDVWLANNMGGAFVGQNSGPKALMGFKLEMRLRHE